MIAIDHLIWDDWNISHIARHAVTPDEVEEACARGIVAWPTYRDRILAVGASAHKRVLAIVMEPAEPPGAYYVITARPASRKERAAYRSQQENIEP